MTIRLTLTLGAVMALSTPGSAQERPLLDPGATRITLDDAVAQVLVRSPLMAQSEQSVVNAGESRRTALGVFIPTVSTSSGMSVRSTERFDPGTDRLVSGSSQLVQCGHHGALRHLPWWTAVFGAQQGQGGSDSSGGPA